MWIENGKAIFYDDMQFNLYDVLVNSTANDLSKQSEILPSEHKNGLLSPLFQCKIQLSRFLKNTSGDNQLYDNVVVAMENEICKIKIFWYKKEAQKYFGDSVVEVCDQFIFSINGRMFWGGHVMDGALNYYNRIVFTLHDNSSRTNYRFEHGNDNTRFGEAELFINSFYAIELPKEINISSLSVSCLQLDSHSCNCTPLTYSIEEKYSSKIQQLKCILEDYNAYGLELDVHEELKTFINNPKLIDSSIKFLSNHLEFTTDNLDSKKHFTFRVSATHNKAYYISAGLADSAVDIRKNDDNSSYFVTFNGSCLDEIELMYRNLMNSSVSGSGFFYFNVPNFYTDTTLNAKDEIFHYLHDNSFYVRLQYQTTLFMQEYSIMTEDSTFYHILKSIDRRSQRRLNQLHKEMIEQGRIKIKWVNEYALFRLIKKHVGDAIYQYHTDWLGNQSIDIFLPSQKVAIEYQGKQHFESIEMFGGESALEQTIERDKRKRQRCFENGIILLEWLYTTPVNEEAVFSFIKSNALEFVEQSIILDDDKNVNTKVEMAPALYCDDDSSQKKKMKQNVEERPPTYIVKQYTQAGDFVAHFFSYKEAASATSISVGQIRSATSERQKTAGGYQWVKFILNDRSEINAILESRESISPMESIGNKSKPICQVSMEGDVVAEYDSIRQASNFVGINSKSIRAVLNGTQKTAAGFYWTYKA